MNEFMIAIICIFYILNHKSNYLLLSAKCRNILVPVRHTKFRQFHKLANASCVKEIENAFFILLFCIVAGDDNSSDNSDSEDVRPLKKHIKGEW